MQIIVAQVAEPISELPHIVVHVDSRGLSHLVPAREGEVKDTRWDQRISKEKTTKKKWRVDTLWSLFFCDIKFVFQVIIPQFGFGPS